MKNNVIGFSLLLIATVGFAADTLHLDKTVKLAQGDLAYVYNNGATIELKNIKGELQQTSNFSAATISFDDSAKFLQTLQAAVKIKDKQAVAKLISYPLRVGGTRLKINSAKDFIDHYSYIMTSKVQETILKQEPYAMFANSQGVMLGSGQVWFNNISNKILIISVNT